MTSPSPLVYCPGFSSSPVISETLPQEGQPATVISEVLPQEGPPATVISEVLPQDGLATIVQESPSIGGAAFSGEVLGHQGVVQSDMSGQDVSTEIPHQVAHYGSHVLNFGHEFFSNDDLEDTQQIEVAVEQADSRIQCEMEIIEAQPESIVHNDTIPNGNRHPMVCSAADKGCSKLEFARGIL
ncbi:hypothetical protein V6N13_059070 [Hibiscus sabdariffa]